MRPQSLRLRLLVGGALWVGVALLISGFAIAYLFTTNVERHLRLDLEASLRRLVASIDPLADPPALHQPLPDPRYESPLSGLYWQVASLESGNTARSRSLWDFVLEPSSPDTAGGDLFFALPGPANQSLSVLLRQVRFTTPEGPRSFLVMVAQDRAVIDESIDRFGRDLAVALLILGAVLLVAAWLQVRLGLNPLHRVRAGIESIRRRGGQRLPEDYPAEVLPLVREVNQLLASQQRSIDFARARAADLAHGLKTPLSVLENVAARLRRSGDLETARLVEDLMLEMADRIDYQLRLSRLHQRTGSHQLSASLTDALTRTVGVLSRTQRGEALDWQLRVEPDVAVDMDRSDLLELAGVLLDNAAKWARRVVSISTQRHAGQAVTIISDDGPGLTRDQIANLGERGQRLDESREGSGLGLAIAREIVGLNAGTLDLDRAPAGGLQVTVRLPLASPGGGD